MRSAHPTFIGNVVPEADREVAKAPLSFARNSSIPGLDLDDMIVDKQSLRPIFNTNINHAFDSSDMKEPKDSYRKQKKSFLKAQRHSLAEAGVNLDKPFGLSPFADVIIKRTR